MQIKLEVKDETVRDLVWTVIESRDPVTGAWLHEVNLKNGVRRTKDWYTHTDFFAAAFYFEVVEDDDGKMKRHQVTSRTVAKGLYTMAAKYPYYFRYILEDNVDAAVADLFLQCVVFGEEKYA